MDVIAWGFFLLAALGPGFWFWSLLSGRANGFPKVWVLGCCLFGIGFYIPGLRADWAALRAGWAMSKLTEREIRFTCVAEIDAVLGGLGGTAGYVKYSHPAGGQNIALLRKDTCAALADFLSDPDDLGRDFSNQEKIFAVHVVSHEARHVLGERNESAADCQALQRNARVALALGAAKSSAEALALIYYQRHYPRHPYFSAECRQGGTLDENLSSSPWNLQAPAASGMAR